jgi:IS5 family transposase
VVLYQPFRGIFMAFRTQSNAAPDAFDAVIAGAPANATLAELDALIDWAPVRSIFAATYDSSGRGQAGFDPVVLYKMLLLEELYALSDVQASREAGDRISFRRFLGLGVAEAPPDDTTLVRFRARVRPGALLQKARREVERQLAAHRLRIQPGSVKVVDATLVPAATRPPKGTSKTDTTDDKPASAPSPEAPPEPVARAAEEPSAAQEAPRRRSRLDPDARFGGKKRKIRFGYNPLRLQDAHGDRCGKWRDIRLPRNACERGRHVGLRGTA